jgi:hypothetical protein
MKPVLVRKAPTSVVPVPGGGTQLVIGDGGPSIRELAGMAFGRPKAGQTRTMGQRFGAAADLAGRGLAAAATTQQIADQMQGGNLAAPLGAYAQYRANQPWQFMQRQKETQPQTQPQSSPTQQQPPQMQPVAPGATNIAGQAHDPNQMMLPITPPTAATAAPPAPTVGSVTPPEEAAAAMTGQPVQQSSITQSAAQPTEPVDPAEAARLLQQQGQGQGPIITSAEPFEHAMDYLLKRLSR